MRANTVAALLVLLLVTSATAQQGSRYRHGRRSLQHPESPEAVEADHSGDFDPTRTIMTRRLMRDRVQYAEQDAAQALRKLRDSRESHPECHARIRGARRLAHNEH